jgi:glycosyltransferase involved in cell wall biosynthesis
MLDPWFNKAYPLKHLKKRLYWPFEYRVLRDAAAVLFTCQEERVLARQSFRPYKVIEEVVSYGTARPAGDAEAQREAFLAAFPKLRDKPFLLFLSRIHPKKGCDVLIKAFAAVHPVRVTLQPGGEAAPMLVIAGPDQVGWNAELVALAERLGVANRIVWPGMLQGDLKWGAFHGCEAFVLPSHQENFGIVVAEAAACGKPVLISNKVNIWREVESDGAGLVSGDNLDGTVDLLRRWAVTSQGERCAMGERARLCFESRFEIHRVAQSLLDVIGKYTGAK